VLALGAVLPLLVGGGCAGYKLGPTGETRAGDRSIQVNPVQNATLEPRLGVAVNHALRKEIQREGTFRLNTRGDGDILLQVDITGYHRRGIAFRSRDTLTADDYEVSLQAKVSATDRRSGRQLVSKELRSRTTVRIGSDLTSAERQALPLLADNLAYQITSLLADESW
jgi:hypothetical protein